MYQLIICEKPNAAKKIADALADNKPTKKSTRDKVPYYELTHEGKKIIVACEQEQNQNILFLILTGLQQQI
jgi:DNA topoisomerase-1